MKRILAIASLLSTFAAPMAAHAMCGCFVAPPPPPKVAATEGRLTNKSSRVVIVRDEERTIITMSNDYHGSASDFAIVIPVATAITREQIHIGEKAPIEALAAATAPQLLEYPAWDPCGVNVGMAMRAGGAPSAKEDASGGGGRGGEAKSLGVHVDASYTVGEYDIQILSATDSDGLATWLEKHGYKLPEGAAPVFESYLRQNMRFFIAKANLKEKAKLGYSYLRPIQIAYESPKFMLPIRLGMLNADGSQEMQLWTVTRRSRVEPTNYRNVRVQSGQGNIPEFVKNDFDSFYASMFANLERREGNDVVFQEYGGYPVGASIVQPPRPQPKRGWWGGGAAPRPPQTSSLTNADLRALGVWWADSDSAFVTRMHFTYDKEHFPEDLVLQATADANPTSVQFSVQDQVDTPSCMSREQWHAQLAPTRDQEAETLSRLTGWDVDDIHRKMEGRGEIRKKIDGPKDEDNKPSWYKNLWK